VTSPTCEQHPRLLTKLSESPQTLRLALKNLQNLPHCAPPSCQKIFTVPPLAGFGLLASPACHSHVGHVKLTTPACELWHVGHVNRTLDSRVILPSSESHLRHVIRNLDLKSHHTCVNLWKILVTQRHATCGNHCPGFPFTTHGQDCPTHSHLLPIWHLRPSTWAVFAA
jgi:hypothetical protein